MELEALLRKFEKEPGYVTALEDVLLPVVYGFEPDPEKIEVVPLGDLLGRVCVEVGIRPAAMATRGQIRAATELVCADLPSDSPLYACRSFPGFHDALASTLRELHHFDVDAERLEEVIPKLPEELRAKFRSLAEVDRGVREALGEIGRAGSLERARALLEGEFKRVPHVRRLLLLAGADIRPLFMRVIRKLADHGVEVWIALDESGAAFEGTQWTLSSLGIPERPKPNAHWTQAIFHEADAGISKPEGVLFSASDALSECEWALRACVDAIGRDGIFPHRIAILVPDPDQYVPLLLASAERFDLRLDARLATPLLTTGLAHLTAKILEVLSQPSPSALPKLAKSSYLQADAKGAAQLAETVQSTLRIHPSGPEAWEALEAFADQEREAFPWLWPLLNWRKNMMEHQRSLSDWHAALYDLLCMDFLEQAAQSHQSQKREHDRRAQTALIRAIADYAPVFDQRRKSTLSLAAFTTIAKRLWKKEEIVLPLSSTEGIRIVSNARQLGACDLVIGLGMLEGVMPRRRREDSVLGDEERHAISEALKLDPPLPDSFHAARAQRDEFLRLCSAAQKRLILGYPETGDDRDNVPTTYLALVAHALGERVRRVAYERRLVVPPKSDCRIPQDFVLSEALASAPDPALPVQLTLAEARQLVRPNFEEGIKVSEASQALSCPFRAVAGHRLRLRIQKLRLENRLHQLPASSGLLRADDPETARKQLQSELGQILTQETALSEPWELNLLELTASRRIEGWVVREFHSRELWKRDPESARVQVPLEDDALRSRFKVGDKSVQFLGQVAGISDHGPYRTIHLYRQSQFKKPDPTDDPGAWLELALHFAMALRAKKPVALQIDSSEGDRCLLVLNRNVGDGLRGDGESFKIDDLAIPPAILADQMRELLAQAVETLERGDMRTVPGDTCNHCDFGELCRSSSVLVDTEALGGENEFPHA